MIVTETEAKQKRCIIVFGAIAMQSVQARNSAAITSADSCIGSRCMAWRWFDRVTVAPEVRRGFCGMASGNVERNPSI
jgi:hypothetical protein